MSTEKKGAAKKEALKQEKRKWKKEQSDKIEERKRQARAARPEQGSGYGKKRTDGDRGPAKRSFGNKTDRPAGKRFEPREDSRSNDNRKPRPFTPKDRSEGGRFEQKSYSKKTFGDKPKTERGQGGAGKQFGQGSQERSFSPKREEPKREEGGNKEGKPFRKPQTPGGQREGSGEKRSFQKPFGDRQRSETRSGDKRAYPKKNEGRAGSRNNGFKKEYPRANASPAEAKEKVEIKKLKPITDEMPLNKYIAHGGVSSRREAVSIIKAGKVKVNGELILEPAHKVSPSDMVTVSGKVIRKVSNLVYILLNKPKDYITTTDDPQDRKTVIDLIGNATQERIYPVGRLDRNTSGVLLLTNDGDLSQKLTHPSNEVKKLYAVTLDKPLTKAHFDAILKGIELEDGPATVDVLAYTDNADKTQIGVEIHSGRNRIVRRIFEHFGYDVKALDRVMFAGLTKKNVNRGKWRFLTEKEVRDLKFFKKGK